MSSGPIGLPIRIFARVPRGDESKQYEVVGNQIVLVRFFLEGIYPFFCVYYC